MLLLFLGGIGAYADDVEFDVTSEGWNVSYSGTANVTLKGRTFTKGEWSGFCLPFDASKETLDAALGDVIASKLTLPLQITKSNSRR